MECGKAAGPCGVVAEMLKAAEDLGVELMRYLTEAVFKNGVIPANLEESYIMNFYKGKGEVLNCGNYQGLKLTDEVMKLVERVLKPIIRRMARIDHIHHPTTTGKTHCC